MDSKRWTLIAVILGSSAVFLESSIVAVALPKIGRDLTSTLLATLEAQNYVYYAYLLALSSLLILAGGLTDYNGRKRMFFIGLVGFGVTSVLCGLAPNMEFLIGARVLQGASGAILVPGSLAIITATFDGEEQGRAFGIWAGASAATTILGPIIGGVLVTYISWRAAFLVGVPVVTFAAFVTGRWMVESRDEEATGQIDIVGAATIALAIGGLTFGAIRGQAQEWQGTAPFMALAVGALCTAAFPIVMRRSDHPLVPLELFKSRNFTVTNISTLLIYGAIYVLIQYLALYTVGVLRYNEIAFGLATVPSTIFLALFSTRFGTLAARYGPRRFMAAGPTVMGLGLLWLIRIPPDSSAWTPEITDLSTFLPPAGYLTDLLPALVVFGIGLMIMVAPLTTALMRSVPTRNSGVASAFNNAVSRVGPQLAGALIFVFISGVFYASLQDSLPGDRTLPERNRQQLSPLNPPPAGAERSLEQAAVEASTDAFHVAMLIAALMCFGGAAVNAVGIVDPAAQEDRPADNAVPCLYQLPRTDPAGAPSGRSR